MDQLAVYVLYVSSFRYDAELKRLASPRLPPIRENYTTFSDLNTIANDRSCAF